MPRKRYTQKGLARTITEAQERHVRLESERIARSVGADPLEAAAALTAASHDGQCWRCEGSGLQPDLDVESADDALCTGCGGSGVLSEGDARFASLDLIVGCEMMLEDAALDEGERR